MKAQNSMLTALPGHADTAAADRGILSWLGDNAEAFSERPAVAGIDHPGLSHAELFQVVSANAATLLAAGIGRGVLVLIVLPNGPDALTAILSVAAVAVAFPLGSDEPQQHIEQILARLPVRALLFDAARPDPYTALCALNGLIPLPVHRELPGPPESTEPAERLAIPSELAQGSAPEPTHIDDAAILTRTAGTTTEPQIIAWSQASLYRSANAAAEWMGLTPVDRSLCVMPFAHLHSLLRSCMPGLLRGGSVVCCPGFDKIRIFDWLNNYRPSYMTAVPTIFRTLLRQAAETGRDTRNTSLRFVATGSDRMDAATAEKLAATFDVTVREFYGMSEVAPMLAATQPGRRAQQDGAIGTPLPGWTLQFRDQAGRALPPGREGEIAVRGGLFNPVLGSSESQRIVDGWYLTGDRGFIDAEGMLHLTGRTDERINRGGKKIAPEAVEEVLAGHPAVARVVVFGYPDPILGQKVVAVVVPNASACGDETTLRIHCAEHLPDYMVPERIHFANDIPVSQTGKVSRRLLAERLDDDAPPSTASDPQGRRIPTNRTETILAELVGELLASESVDLETDFMDLGGDSFLAVSLLTVIEDRLQLLLSPADLLANGSVAALARLIDARTKNREDEAIVLVQQGGPGAPLFFAHAPMGYTFYAHTFARHMGAERRVYACQWQRPTVDPEAGYGMEQHATQYVAAIRRLEPIGPYCLAGHSFGAHLAFEIAQQLHAAGEQVAFLGLIDDEADLFKRRFRAARRPSASTRAFDQCVRLLATYAPRSYPGAVDLFVAEAAMPESLSDPLVGWGDLALGGVSRHPVPGDHVTMMSEGRIARWATLFKERISIGCTNISKADPAQQPMPSPVRTNAFQAAGRARRAAIAGDLTAEIAEYQAAMAATPDLPYWVYRNCGLALLQHGRTAPGLEALQQAIKHEALPIPGLRVLADALRKLGRKDEARLAVAHAERIAPPSAHAQLALGAMLAVHGLLRQAEAALRQAVSLGPPNAKALKALAQVLQRLHRPHEAIALVQQAITLRPNAAGQRFLLATLLMDIDDMAGTEVALRRVITLQPRHGLAHLRLAELLAADQRHQEATLSAGRAKQLRPNDPDVASLLARLPEPPTAGDGTPTPAIDPAPERH